MIKPSWVLKDRILFFYPEEIKIHGGVIEPAHAATGKKTYGVFATFV